MAKSFKKGGFGPPICTGMVCPRFRTCIFKLHLLPSMWPVLVEFRSAISEGSGRKKKGEEEDRIALKPKCVDKHVGRPSNFSSFGSKG